MFLAFKVYSLNEPKNYYEVLAMKKYSTKINCIFELTYLLLYHMKVNSYTIYTFIRQNQIF